MFRLGVIGLDSELAANLLIVLEGLLTGYDIHPPHIKNRFVDKDGNDVVMAVKSCILNTFNFVLDVQMVSILWRLISDCLNLMVVARRGYQ
jgi:hypothetical protein